MFEFPSSPTLGQSANGYVYDGTGWLGGGLSMAGPITEEFFNIPAGAALLDIPVPAWATAVQIIGAVFTPNATNNILMRVSADGTNFFAGASDYNVSGPVHNTGSSGYGNVAGAASSYLYIGASGDQGQAVPHSFTVEMNLTRPSTSTAFSQKAYAKMYDSNAATLQRTFWHQGWLASNVTTALALKAIRIYASPGPMNAGSWVKVNWLGPATDLPRTNAIPEAPSTGGEYVRVNGVWRLKSQTLVLTGANIAVGVPVAVPTGARMVKWNIAAASAASFGMTMRVSVDGTNFIAAADYATSGTYFSSASSTPVNQPAAAATYILLSTNQVAAAYALKSEGNLVIANTNSMMLGGFSKFATVQSAAHYTGLFQSYLSGSSFGGVTALKALNFGAHASTGTFSEGFADLEWVY
jgi:hypothetical protein